jgi:DNA polymerase (family 10)
MYDLDYASLVAERLVAGLEPCCERITVAGSIRRRRPQVKDIDLVVIPTTISALGMALLRRGEILTKKRLDSSTKIIKFRYRNASSGSVPVDIYIADRETWSMLLLVRTGSATHNQRLAMLAQSKGLQFKANGDGILDGDGRRISGDTEASIFAALGLDYVPPEERE